MAFPVCKVQGTPQFDSLPVAKIIDYPLEQGPYKPFAQGYLCLSRDGFFVRLWAFEVIPEPGSRLRATLRLQKEGPLLAVEWAADHQICFTVNGAERDASLLGPHFFEGEDLQGLYWGASVEFPHALLAELYPGLALMDGMEIEGNLYKLCDGDRPHRGSFLPVDWSAAEPLGADGLGRMIMADY